MRKLALVALALVPLVAVADTPIAYRLGKGAQLTPYPSCHTAVLKASNNGMLCVDSSASNVLKYKNPAGATITLGAAGAGTGYATILDEGSTLTQQTSVNFIGAGISCVDNGGASRTDCTISGSGTGNWTFTGDAADDSGAAVLTIGATTATGVTIGRTAGANILAADTTLASGKTLTGAAASDLYLNAVTGQLVRLRVNGSNMLSVSSTAATLTVPLVMTGTQTGTYTLGGTPTITAPVVSGGLTASGSAANDFSASTGTFLTSTGIVTLGGSQIKLTNGDLDPQNDNVIDLGDSTHKYRQVWGTSLFASSVDPLTDSTDDLGDGAGTKFWSTGYINDISFKSSTGPFTIGAYGAANPYLSLGDTSCSTGAWSGACNRIRGLSAQTTLDVAPAVVTGLTASTEYVDVLFNFSRGASDTQHATGDYANQRAFLINTPRYSFVGSSTITDAATMAIEGAPVASTNAIMTNSHALWVMDGTATFENNNVGATVGTTGAWLRNRIDATAANQKYSPALIWSGNGWKTDATAASQSTKFLAQVIPVQGTANPTVGLSFQSNVNAAGWVERLNIGNTAILASVPITANLGATTVAPTWTAVTYTNSYVDFGGSWSGTAYTKDAMGIVHVRVAAKSGTAAAGIFTLPAGYRPGGNRHAGGYSDSGSTAANNQCQVTQAGVVSMFGGGTTAAICTLVFHAEN